MKTPTYKELLDAGVHFGHLKRKWNPKMLPYIFMERRGIHIIDINRTIEALEEAGKAVKAMAKAGKKIMFVATKKQVKGLIVEAAKSVDMPYVADRWLGGMMTNFSTIRKSVKKMQSINSMLVDKSLSVTKKERLTLTRERDKMEKVFGGIANLNRLPSAVFIVDISHEHIAVKESQKLGLKTFGIVDTNSDPNLIDYSIPANDDASKSVKIITDYMVACIKEGLAERQGAKSNKGKKETKEETAA